MQQPMLNFKDITDLTFVMNMAIVLMAKVFKLNYSTPTNNNQRIYPTLEIGRLLSRVVQNAVQNLGIQNVGNQNRVIVVSGIANQNRNGNVVGARAEGNTNGNNGNQIRCYNCIGLGHLTRNCTVRPRRRDAAYLQTQLLIAQKEEAGIQLQAEEFDLMATAADLDEIKEVNADCILMANLQQASTSGTQSDKAPVYDSDGSAENKLHDMIFENAKLRAQLFDEVSEQKDTTKGTSTNTKFTNQSTERKPFLQSLRNKSVVRQPNVFQSDCLNFSKTRVPQQVDKTNDLSNLVTSNSVPATKESKVVDYDKVITPGMFRINPFKNSRKVKFVPNKPVNVIVRTNPITAPQPHVITKKVVNSDSHGFSSTGVDITTKTRRPQPRSNTKNDRVPSASKSSRVKNKEVEVEDHPRNLLLSKEKKHMSSKCNNIKLAIRNDKSEVVCAMWSKERLASTEPSKPRMRLRWSPTGKMFDIKGKLIASSESNGDNACTPNPQEPTIKRCPNSTFSLGRSLFVKGNHTTNLYTINLHDMVSASPICLMSRATSIKSWLWNQCLSHLKFDTINDHARNDLITGLPKFRYHKEHLCPSCEHEKSKRSSHPPKPVPNSKQRLHLLHIDLCGPIRIANINGKRYVLVIVDDYSCYTWVVFLRSKDEAPEEIKTFIKKITVLLQAPVIIVKTDIST
nr:retrovirus-related Pol polyprotein from transposon TNT 1-94 [Tanacetum cinerariifolium]